MKMVPTGSYVWLLSQREWNCLGRIMMCGLVRVGVALQVDFEFKKPTPSPNPRPLPHSLCLLPADQDVKLSVTAPAPCLSASLHGDYEPPSKNVSKFPMKCFFYKLSWSLYLFTTEHWKDTYWYIIVVPLRSSWFDYAAFYHRTSWSWGEEILQGILV